MQRTNKQMNNQTPKNSFPSSHATYNFNKSIYNFEVNENLSKENLQSKDKKNYPKNPNLFMSPQEK